MSISSGKAQSDRARLGPGDTVVMGLNSWMSSGVVGCQTSLMGGCWIQQGCTLTGSGLLPVSLISDVLPPPGESAVDVGLRLVASSGCRYGNLQNLGEVKQKRLEGGVLVV